MQDVLDRKLRQMHAALGALATDDLSSVKPKIESTPTYHTVSMEFNTRPGAPELDNAVSLLVANIASLKDHLKHWCFAHGVAFKGDKLIDTNLPVGVVHDLWNVDKHMVLTSKSRSGRNPRVQDVRTAMRLSTGPEGGSGVMMMMNPETGQLTITTKGGGSAKLALVAQIVDGQGAVIGDFTNICEDAAAAWEHELKAAGVQLP